VRKALLGAAFCLLLAGCKGTAAAKFTPFPYSHQDEAAEIIGKSLVNIPVWTLEGVAATGIVAFYAAVVTAILWAQSGASGLPGR